MGYNLSVLVGIFSILLRIFIVVAVWASIWRFVKPRTRFRRILRAAALALALLLVRILLPPGG